MSGGKSMSRRAVGAGTAKFAGVKSGSSSARRDKVSDFRLNDPKAYQYLQDKAASSPGAFVRYKGDEIQNTQMIRHGGINKPRRGK